MFCYPLDRYGILQRNQSFLNLRHNIHLKPVEALMKHPQMKYLMTNLMVTLLSRMKVSHHQLKLIRSQRIPSIEVNILQSQVRDTKTYLQKKLFMSILILLDTWTTILSSKVLDIQVIFQKKMKIAWHHLMIPSAFILSKILIWIGGKET